MSLYIDDDDIFNGYVDDDTKSNIGYEKSSYLYDVVLTIMTIITLMIFDYL
jgi:hypothetical protein